MGNVLRSLEGEDDHGGRDQYPYYRPSSRPPYRPPYYSHDQPAAAPARPHQQALGAHGFTALPADFAGLEYILNFKSTSMAAVPDITYLQGSSESVDDRVLSPHHQHSTEDIDESSAEGLSDAESYVKANEMLIQVHVLGTTKTFWRLSDEATRISRKLALILRSYHSVGKYLSAPLQVSNVWISSAGSVKLRGVRFASKRRFSIQRVRDDYKYLSRVLQALIRISGGDITKLPPDYEKFLALLESNTLTKKDEFLIVNNPALLPMSNRTEVFLRLYDRIVKYLGRNEAGRAKQKRILSNLPYEDDWWDTATANTKIKRYLIKVPKKYKKYKKTQLDQLRFNRNVRSHLLQYSDDSIEEILYYEWPELLMDMVKMLHMEGELESTHIQNKFGYCPSGSATTLI